MNSLRPPSVGSLVPHRQVTHLLTATSSSGPLRANTGAHGLATSAPRRGETARRPGPHLGAYCPFVPAPARSLTAALHAMAAARVPPGRRRRVPSE